jgi:hypothetical protein
LITINFTPTQWRLTRDVLTTHLYNKIVDFHTDESATPTTHEELVSIHSALTVVDKDFPSLKDFMRNVEEIENPIALG